MNYLVLIGGMLFFSAAVSANPVVELATKALKVLGVGHEAASIERGAPSGARDAGERAAKALDTHAPIPAHEAPGVDAANVGRTALSEMDFSIEPKGASEQKLAEYKRLRENGRNGDIKAVLEAHRFARDQHITDTGEPYYGYWLFWQLTRPLSIELRKRLQEQAETDCRSQSGRRQTDRGFDASCRALQGPSTRDRN